MEDLDRKIAEDQGTAGEETLPERDADGAVCEEGKPFFVETIAVDEPSGDEEHASETGSGSSSTGPLPPDQEDDYDIASGGSLDLDLEDEIEIELCIEEDESKPLMANCVQIGGAHVGTTVGFFKVEAELGKGAQAIVFQARHEDGRLVALKVGQGRDDVRALRREQSTLCKLNHPNIMRLVEELQTPSCLVLELHTGGDLFMFAYHNASPQRSLRTEEAMQAMFTEVLNGVQYIHSQSIPHKDIKLLNLLLHAEGSQRVILCDFASDQAVPGTWGYMSEEVWDGKRGIPYCVYAADLWACGCVWWGLMNATAMPFDISRPSLCQYTLPNNVEFAQPDQAFLMLDPLLNREPVNRNLDRAIVLAADVLGLLQAMQ